MNNHSKNNYYTKSDGLGASSAHRWLQLATLTTWIVLLGGGLVGFSLPYAKPFAPEPTAETPPFEAISIELTENSETQPVDQETALDLQIPFHWKNLWKLLPLPS